MKKLINYLGENNVVISIVENGDSIDNTRKYLKDFQDYLNQKNIINRFSLTKEIEDPRLKIKAFLQTPPSRIEYYSKLIEYKLQEGKYKGCVFSSKFLHCQGMCLPRS